MYQQSYDGSHVHNCFVYSSGCGLFCGPGGRVWGAVYGVGIVTLLPFRVVSEWTWFYSTGLLSGCWESCRQCLCCWDISTASDITRPHHFTYLNGLENQPGWVRWTRSTGSCHTLYWQPGGRPDLRGDQHPSYFLPILCFPGLLWSHNGDLSFRCFLSLVLIYGWKGSET